MNWELTAVENLAVPNGYSDLFAVFCTFACTAGTSLEMLFHCCDDRQPYSSHLEKLLKSLS